MRGWRAPVSLAGRRLRTSTTPFRTSAACADAVRAYSVPVLETGAARHALPRAFVPSRCKIGDVQTRRTRSSAAGDDRYGSHECACQTARPEDAAAGRNTHFFFFAHETAEKGAIYFCSNRDETRRLYAPWRTGVRRAVCGGLGRGGGPESRPFARASAGRVAVDTGKCDTHGACERAGNGSRTLYVRGVGIREACAARLGDGRWGWRGRDPSSSARCPA